MRFILRMAWRDSRASRRRLVLYSLSVVLGIAVFLIPDVVDETVPTHHIDEFIDYSLGVICFVWLFWPGLRFRAIPVWLVIAGLALASNLLGILIEFNERDDVGGDILTASLMIVAIAIQLYRLRRARLRA